LIDPGDAPGVLHILDYTPTIRTAWAPAASRVLLAILRLRRTGEVSIMFAIRVGILLAALAVLHLPSDATAAPACGKRVNNTQQKLLECVTLNGVRAHQAALQAIADANNGHRPSGTAGYDASVDYVADLMASAGYLVTVQPFQFLTFISLSPSVLEQVAPPPAGPIVNNILAYSGSGDVTASVTALPAPPADTTPGCEAADFAGFPAGNIALISRGSCTFAVKATNAYNAGASGVVIYNSMAGPLNGTLGNDFTLDIPVTSVTQEVGQQLAATPGLVLRLKTDVLRGEVTSYNVLAESRGGDPNRVIMVGAHLDSVDAGPGIQDNGSGSAAILETALQMARVNPRNKVRFAWWGAHESGLVGSNYYVESLSDDERARIALYLDFHMIGSPNYVRFIYDGDGSEFGLAAPDGSAAIEAYFQGFYAARGLESEPTEIAFRSDYAAFFNYGIPFGGLFTGAEGIKTPAQAAVYGGTAGVAYDPCFHLACDTYDNVSLEVLDLNADAVASATLHYAMMSMRMSPPLPPICTNP
jgi:Zn-dependent M28 family amino/carboxypeptidase